MNSPKYYKVTDPDQIEHYVRDRAFAALITKAPNFFASHIPMMYDAANNTMLAGHIANKNPQQQHLVDGTEVLLLFSGPDAYISPSWYMQPSVPTWDYKAVHITGKIQLQTKRQLRQSLHNLVHHFESQQPNPIYLDALPKEMIDSYMPMITGFYVHIETVRANFKLSQNKDRENRQRIIDHLEQSSSCPAKDLAKAIRKASL